MGRTALFFIVQQEMQDRLFTLLEPVVAGLGYELLHLELEGRGRNALLRLYIDHRTNAGIAADVEEVTLGDCEVVSREVSAFLDVADPLPEAYRLEVSSPGLDRPLAKREHFERFRGREARVVLEAPMDGRRKFKGLIDDVVGDEVILTVDGEHVALPLNAIRKARLVPEI